MLHFFCLGMWLRQISSIDHLAVKNALQQDSPAQNSAMALGHQKNYAYIPIKRISQKKLIRRMKRNEREFKKREWPPGIRTSCHFTVASVLLWSCPLTYFTWHQRSSLILCEFIEVAGKIEENKWGLWKQGIVFGSSPSCFTWCMYNDHPTFP